MFVHSLLARWAFPAGLVMPLTRLLVSVSQATIVLTLFASLPGNVSAAEPVDFNRDIRSLLSNNCYQCHGPDEAEVQAGLRLDSRDHATKASDSGTAIVPGNPDQSLLIKRILADESERMPPAESGKKLSAEEKELLVRWVREGAPYAQHWSYVKPARPALPKVADDAWARNDIDRFILARLQQEGLKPQPEADRYTLIRRLSLDLTGLPPTVAEVDEFINDQDPYAYENLVNRLLAKNAYGEHWARLWLDLARYADSAGYADDPPRTIWMFRDAVIRAVNQNKPFDQLTREFIAGDLLPQPSQEQLLLTAFHRNTLTNNEGGTNDEEFRNVAVVDRVNTTMAVWMGTTINCCQCHTHKYDPITQAEFYQLFAFFNNTEDADKRDESPNLMIVTAEQESQRAKLQQEIDDLQQALQTKLAQEPDAKEKSLLPRGPLKAKFVRIENPGKGALLHLAEVQAFVGEKNVAASGTASQISTGYDGPAKLAIDGNTDGNYAAKSVSHTGNGDDPWWEVDLGDPVVLVRIVLWNRTDNGLHARLKNFRVIALDAKRNPLWVRTTKASPNPSVTFELPAAADALTKADQQEITKYAGADKVQLPEEKKLEKLKADLAKITGVPTPIMRDLPEDRRRKTFVQLRGSFMNLGDQVFEGTPSAFNELKANGETPNRLDLANWLVDENNPLTARVTVNRYWAEIFGSGIVRTTEEFGSQGELPSHPQLLDWLAVELQESGWDVKHLLKLMVTSAAYRQSSRVTPELYERDPDNRLLARGPRVQLTAEMIRDQALAVSGLLSDKMYGQPVRPPQPSRGLRAAFGSGTDWQTSTGEDRYRRGLYTTWRRSNPYPSMAEFGAPNREVCTLRRPRTNTPLQPLVTMNDDVYVEAAQALARRMAAAEGNVADKAKFGFRLCVSRKPSERELAIYAALYEAALKRYAGDLELATKMATQPLGAPQEGANVAELAAWTVVGTTLLNLDEMFLKR